MIRAVWALCLVGCMVPGSRTTTRTVSQTFSDPIAGEPSPLEFETKVIDSTVHVIAQWPRECYRRARDIVEDTTTPRAEMLGAPGNGWIGWVAGIVFWPVGLGSIVVTQVVVHAEPPTIKTREVQGADSHEPCPVPAANTSIVLTLPSGTEIDATTDERGQFMLLLAPDEATAAVRVRAKTR